MKEVVDSRKSTLGRVEALELARAAGKVIAAKGKKVVSLDMSRNPSDSAVLEVMLGPTGNLRAPTIRRGKTLLVGFHAEIYSAALK